jgi:hypothetical protein
MERMEFVKQIINNKYDRCTKRVIERIKDLGRPDFCLSGDDSGLDNVWEEFKSQVQEEESFFYEAYEDTIRAICRELLKTISLDEIKLMWIFSNAYYDHYEDDFPEDIEEEVENELYSRIYEIAEVEQINRDYDEDVDY